MLIRMKERFTSYWITALVAVMLAVLCLLIGIGELIHPDVPEEFLSQNILACITLIVIGLALLAAVIWPYWVGILLGVWGISFLVISHFNLGVIIWSIPIMLIAVRLYLEGSGRF